MSHDVQRLPNLTALEWHVVNLRATGNRMHAVVYIDIDRMHLINNLFGFSVGDEILRCVGALWPEGRAAGGGFVGRLAGDRFAAVVDCRTLNQARTWAERTRRDLEALALPAGCPGLKLSASFGVAMLEESVAFEAALMHAEMACRSAKDHGGRRVELFTNDDHSLARRQQDVQVFRDLTAALDQGTLELDAQPIVPLADTTRPIQYELLVRLRNGMGAKLPPDQFLSAARRYQLLPQLDLRVLERACADIAPFTSMLMARRAKCWVNIAGPSISEPEFADQARMLIKHSGIPGRLIGFEVTETAAIENFEAATRFIKRLRELGCSFALDDFGSGFSSLTYLQKLAVDGIKIDGAFVRDLFTGERAEALIRTVVDVAGRLGLDTVAERITNGETAARLTRLGVTFGQGFHFSPPQPLQELLAGLM